MALVYRYGLRDPEPACAQQVEDQLRLAHRYYNKLIEIELRKRKAGRKLEIRYDGGAFVRATTAHVTAEIAAKAADAAVKEHRSQNKTRKCPPALMAALKQAKLTAKLAGETKRAAKQALRAMPQVQQAWKRVSDGAEIAAKKARAAFTEQQLFWGAYLLVEAAVRAARGTKTSDPHFHRWSGEGSIGVQIQKGLFAAALIGGKDTRVRIDPVPSTAWDRDRSPEQRTRVHIRIGSHGRKPIWATWPLIMHRPFPPGARVKWVKVVRELIANKARWSLHVTLDVPPPQPACGEGLVAIGLGWRKTADQDMRVAYAQDTKGVTQPIMLPAEILTGMRKTEELRSIRDDHQNVMHAAFLAWLQGDHATAAAQAISFCELYLQKGIRAKGRKKGQNCIPPDRQAEVRAMLVELRAGGWPKLALPEWFREASMHAHAWKSPRRFAGLALRWREQRWPGDAAGYHLLEMWRCIDKHLWQYEANLRDKLQHRRLDHYRQVALDLARQYATLVLGDFDLRETQKHVPLEKQAEDPEITQVHWQQRVACCSSLRSCLINAFRKLGGSVYKVDPKLTTRTCRICGYAGKWRNKKELMHLCPQCGNLWDRDWNETWNLIQRYQADPAQATDALKVKPSPWAKRHKPKPAA